MGQTAKICFEEQNGFLLFLMLRFADERKAVSSFRFKTLSVYRTTKIVSSFNYFAVLRERVNQFRGPYKNMARTAYIYIYIIVCISCVCVCVRLPISKHQRIVYSDTPISPLEYEIPEQGAETPIGVICVCVYIYPVEFCFLRTQFLRTNL